MLGLGVSVWFFHVSGPAAPGTLSVLNLLASVVRLRLVKIPSVISENLSYRASAPTIPAKFRSEI